MTFQAVVSSSVGWHVPPASRAAIDAIAQRHRQPCVAVVDAPVGVGRLEDVAQRALGVVDLRLEVVALADHRRIQLDAGTDRQAQLVVGMTVGVMQGLPAFR